jgi:hypothetical protein
MSSIPDAEREPVLTVERAGELLGLSRSAAYTAASQFLQSNGREGLPVLRFNSRTLRVPTARLLELLGIDAPSSKHGAHANSDGAQNE